MSLVAYDYSDDEEDQNEEDEQSTSNTKVTLNKNPIIEKQTEEQDETPKVELESEEESTSKPSIDKLTMLPASNTFKSIGIDVSWSVLDKHRTQPIRIPIPRLEKEKLSSEEERKKKPSVKGSGLFAVLPKPKNELIKPAATLKPTQVQKRPTPVQIKKVNKSTMKPSKNKVKEKDSDSEEEIESDSFFFVPESDNLVHEPVDLPPIPTLQEETGHEIDQKYYDDQAAVAALQVQEEPVQSQPLELDEEALAKLCGTRDRRGMKQEIVDVNGSALIGDAKEWLMKELSKETARVPMKRKGEHSHLSKRKHQITYLAQHAKANELELQNQWANNRMTKKQTQAKYGF